MTSEIAEQQWFRIRALLSALESKFEFSNLVFKAEITQGGFVWGGKKFQGGVIITGMPSNNPTYYLNIPTDVLASASDEALRNLVIENLGLLMEHSVNKTLADQVLAEERRANEERQD